MVLEYLFLDSTHKEALSNFSYKPGIIKNGKNAYEDVKGTIHDFEDTEHWVISFRIENNDREAAKILSRINDTITQLYSPIVLSNESSEYFNKSLYPLANKFERLLRKYLYLKWNSYTGEELPKVIKNLEEKDFGEISNILFIDDDFNKKIKERINAKGSSGVFSKSDLICIIGDLEEKTTWNAIIGNDVLQYIRENFNAIKNYRNDVMHAHNFGYEHFLNAQKMFETANSELEKEISNILSMPQSPIDSKQALNTLLDKIKDVKVNDITVNEGMKDIINQFMDKYGHMKLSELHDDSDSEKK